MDINNVNIDNLLRDKFESFTPAPPSHVWGSIEKSIDSKPAMFFMNRKQITIAAILLLLALIGSFIVFDPFSNSSTGNNITNTQIINETIIAPESETLEINSSAANNISSVKDTDNSTSVNETNNKILINASNTNNDQIIVTELNDESNVKSDVEEVVQLLVLPSTITPNKSTYSNYQTDVTAYYIGAINSRNNYSIIVDDISDYNPENRSIDPVPSNYDNEIKIPSISKNSMWKIGYYVSPELTISNIDSVEILNSYSINVEPTYFFNDHWFIRSGLGLTFTRDRGYARIKYIANELMGSYDDVYDITFDTLSGNIIPTYHTKTVEVWDTVRHVSVSSITNSYLYLQVPLLFGYSSKSSRSPFSWYFLGGPAFYFKTSSWIETPEPENENADIIELKNNLPVRSNNYFQLWLGAGLEYEINNKLSVAAEPSYRHYLSNIYSNADVKGPSSGFVFRVGLVYKLK